MTNQIVSSIGIHSIGGKRKDYGPFCRRIYDAGRELSLVKVRDDFGALDEPLEYWPNIMTIGAVTDFDRLPFDFDKFLPRAKLNHKVKVWEVLNEDDSPHTYDAKADMYIRVAHLFKENGMGIGLFSCGSGNPPYPSEDGGISYTAIARACRHMLDNDINAVLCLHEYHTDGGGTIGRFKVLADYLQECNCLLPIAITEFGTEVFEGDTRFMNMIRAYDPTYMVDDRVIGCATWTLGGGGWGRSNYQTALPELGDYIATVQPIVPPPPDPTIAFHGTCKLSVWPDVSLAAIAAGATIEKTS